MDTQDIFEDKELYNKYKERKKNGEMLDFDKVTCDELKQIWYEESISDSLIADLFDVSQSKVRKKRSDFGLNMHSCSFEDLLKNPEFIEGLIEYCNSIKIEEVKAGKNDK